MDTIKILLDGQEYVAGTQTELAGMIGSHAVSVTVTDKAGIEYTAPCTFEVITSLRAMNQLLDRYEASCDLKGPLLAQLEENLKQAEHQLEIGSKEQAIKHLGDFAKHLNNPALHENITENAKNVLNASANYLISKWSK